MAQQSNSARIIILVSVLIAAGIGFFAYSYQAKKMEKTATATPSTADAAKSTTATPTPVPVKIDPALLAPRPNDIIVGDANAMTTIVEYSSLSCPHCAHFHKDVLPQLEKEFITPGKVKLVIRHFPLNDPALKAAELVECAGANGGNRANFEKVLFDMQQQWAYDESYLKNLKQIALVGGIDSAAFDSCMADKDIEARIVASRQEAADKLGVDSTPTFFINGKKLTGDFGIDNFRKTLADAGASK